MNLPWSDHVRNQNAPDASSAWLVVGLGNPEPRYLATRHNLGYWVVDELAGRHGIDVGIKRHRALVGVGAISGRQVTLLKPLTSMNLSGRAVQEAVAFRKYPLERVVVVSDDLDLPMAKVRVRPSGSAGGHGGLKSIINMLGTQEFGRVRVGIGRPPDGDVIDFVLTPFHPQEIDEMKRATEKAADAVEEILTRGYVSAMQAVNG